MSCVVPGLRCLKPGLAVALALLLGACASSQRLTGPFGSERLDGVPRAAPAQTGALYGAPSVAEPASPGVYSSAPITSQDLPPPSPQYGAPAPPPSVAGAQLEPAPVLQPQLQPQVQPEVAPVRQPPTLSGGGTVATLGASNSPSGLRPSNSRDGVIGSWTAREANGASCRVQLTSAPALDRYKANASGCANKDLQKATTWDYQDGEVYLYQPGGNVVARLKAQDAAAMSGVVAKSGAGLTLSR